LEWKERAQDNDRERGCGSSFFIPAFRFFHITSKENKNNGMRIGVKKTAAGGSGKAAVRHERSWAVSNFDKHGRRVASTKKRKCDKRERCQAWGLEQNGWRRRQIVSRNFSLSCRLRMGACSGPGRRAPWGGLFKVKGKKGRAP